MLVDKRNIALVTTWYPPVKGVAVNRMLSFSKYLDKDKYNVTVYTLGDKEDRYFDNDCEIITIPENKALKLPVFYAQDHKIKHILKIFKKLFLLKIIRVEQLWGKKVLNKLNKKDENYFDLIITSYAPKEVHEVGFEFKKKNPEIKWILDMRDEMSSNPSNSIRIKNSLFQLERKYAKLADAVLTVSEPILNAFKSTMNEVVNFEEVRNGFDHDYYISEVHYNDTFTINYTGTFYGTNKPDLFLNVLAEIYTEKSITDFKVRFIGSAKNFSIPLAISSKINFIDKCNYQKAIEYCNTADLNLIIINFPKRKGVFTGKLFDYLSVGQPILALVDKEDVAANLIQKSSCNFVASAQDFNEVKKSLLSAFENWKLRKVEKPKKEEVYKYHRKVQVDKLNRLIENIFE